MAGAQRLQFTRPEEVRVAFMRLDVIGGDSRGDPVLLGAYDAQWVGVELRLGPSLPAGEFVPVSIGLSLDAALVAQ